MIHSQLMMGQDIQPPRTAVLPLFVTPCLPQDLHGFSGSLDNTELYWDLMDYSYTHTLLSITFWTLIHFAPLCPYWLPSVLNTSLHTLVEYFVSLSQNSILLLGELEVNVASRTEKPWVGPDTTWGIVSFSEECDLKSPIQPTNHLLKRLQ